MKQTIDWRRLALYLLPFGLAGTATALALLGHTEDRLQWTPLILLLTGFLMGLAMAVQPVRRVVLIFRALMGLYLPASALGLYLHVKSNVEFELEMRPAIAGMELIVESLTGAMPALAPGTMAQMGLLGLLVCFRHPALGASVSAGESSHNQSEGT